MFINKTFYEYIEGCYLGSSPYVIVYVIVFCCVFSSSRSFPSDINNEGLDRRLRELDPRESESDRLHEASEPQTVPNIDLGPGIDSDTAESSLVLAQVVFRHGDRSPIHTYPNDPHKDEWPQGLGQLTKKGWVQAYQLGSFLRSRYRELIGKQYSHEEVYFRSTDTDRTLMTAECVAAGLFPLNDSDTDSVPWPLGEWQPIPIHSHLSKTDRVLHPDHACDYVHDVKAGVNANYAKKTLINEKTLMFTLSRQTGMDINFTSLHFLSDIIFCQNAHGMSQPRWMTKEIQSQLLDYYRHRPSITPEDAKYLSGTLLDTMTDNMLKKTQNKSDLHKLYLYSAHDNTVSSLMALLGVDNRLHVPYTGSFIVELHLIGKEYFVKLLYRNSTDLPPQRLVAKHCRKAFCPLKDFHEKYQYNLLTDEEWEEVCGDSSDNLTVSDNAVPILVAVLVALLGLNMCLGYKVCTYKSKVREGPQNDQYALLQNVEESSDSETEDPNQYTNPHAPKSNNSAHAVELHALSEEERDTS